MMHSYRCDSCGCYLDPGEGLLCDECRERMHEKVQQSERMRRFLNTEEPHIKMNMEEMV